MRGSILVQALKREGVAVTEVASDREGAGDAAARPCLGRVRPGAKSAAGPIRDAQLRARVRLRARAFRWSINTSCRKGLS